MGSFVPFYKKVTVRSSKTEHRGRGTLREWKHHADCTDYLHVGETQKYMMSYHTDCSETADAGNNRGLEGHAPLRATRKSKQAQRALFQPR